MDILKRNLQLRDGISYVKVSYSSVKPITLSHFYKGLNFSVHLMLESKLSIKGVHDGHFYLGFNLCREIS